MVEPLKEDLYHPMFLHVDLDLSLSKGPASALFRLQHETSMILAVFLLLLNVNRDPGSRYARGQKVTDAQKFDLSFLKTECAL